ncbi:histidinol-phosphate transaminase [Desulfofustis limnaeus]|jgi:histidinol-phosphate aminotransferase|uniref:Histidinol-phosphate aminotransferase n=1 Tax=Desulfofustis limnaeus TaxID=2740163 RepID=A0ABM7W6I2_9BACT|nr:histidinol-phosphate transaminase [Desulfofustis limnaeus]MDX9894984.1 histidinol-phosphate transaminase [Desulfofustis sp.]BDD86562.1 histidinol-phosphate aminotransferase [Desulfofustis limnaeus]
MSIPGGGNRVARLIKPQITALPLYNAGLPEDFVSRKYGATTISRLASNENPLGMSPRAHQAARLALDSGWKYSDPTAAALKAALADHTSISADRIVVGNGSEELIALLCRACLRPGDQMVTVTPSFLLHEIYALEQGAEVVRVALTGDHRFAVDDLVTAVSHGCRLLMFSNPSNPVGCFLDDAALARVLAATDPDTLVVLDEAYYEYAVALPGFPNSLEMLADLPNPWAVLRTFSKAYGMAGLRVGYGLLSEATLVEHVDKIRQPFNVNCLAQAAAIAAIGDTDFLTATVTHNRSNRELLAAGVTGLGLSVAPSAANFLFIDCRQNSTVLAERLLRHGIIVKPWTSPGYETCLRVTVGSSEDLQHFLNRLGQLL